MLDVVIPARDEATSMGATLAALLADADDIPLHVVIALNGEDQEYTERLIKEFALPFAKAGHTLITVRCERVGKHSALNAGDRARSGGPVLYLDADAIILPGTLAALSEAMETGEPRLVGPKRIPILPETQFARSFGKVLHALPAIENFVGMGCYGVNEAARRLWNEFPAIVADDAFVFTRFSPSQRVLVADGGIWFELPPAPALPKMVRRWKDGNKAPEIATRLRRKAPVDVAWMRSNCRLLPNVPAYLLVLIAAKFSTSAVSNCAWRPLRRPMVPAPPRRLRTRVVIVTYDSAPYIEFCLDSLLSKWSDLDIVIVDNASSDDTVAITKRHGSNPRIIRNASNLGFAQAVNQGAEGNGFDYLLLCNPDVVVKTGSIDALVSLALRFPLSGLHGGRMTDSRGLLDHTSVLARPGLWHAAAFAIGASFLPGAAMLDPDRLRGWDRRGTRHVPILSGGLLLISGGLWTKLGGLDPAFFLYGEDVDFCMRAVDAGANPLSTDRAHYTHIGGASSSDAAVRAIRILGGKAILYRRLVPMCGVLLLKMGVALRAQLERISGQKTLWQTCWLRRKDWLNQSKDIFP